MAFTALTAGRTVTTEFGQGVVIATSGRRVAIELIAGSEQPGCILNIATGTPGYGRLVALNP